MTSPSSLTEAYADRLKALGAPRWKRWLNVQAPYRWNLRRLRPGFTLDVGCGIGRNLRHLGGRGVGVDPNPACIGEARDAGLQAFTPDAFDASEYARPGRFDSLLIAHVLEHVEAAERRALLARYLPYVRPGGQVILITPQEAGFASDRTHVEFVSAASLRALLDGFTLERARNYSFPLPRVFGRVFLHNEFVVTGRVPGATS